ncbi:hypothetical protein EKO04_002675 [Ascochyta lentis]|uniref:DUF7708 domain-containing protein n=1 Tax=Ascochyta lentis TaxID=205686 RepID=A0A8H7MK98_9PLEO|nr:hypothetical protein EKO04_002675 [Ascochyta lentis]
MEATTNQNWFEKNESTATLWSPIEELYNDRKEWTLKPDSYLDDDTSITKVAKDPAGLYSCSRSEVEQAIEQLTAQKNLESTMKAHGDWRAGQQSGRTRKIGAATQNLLCTIGNFLQTFSGIAEIVKSVDQQIGGLAYGTIMLLVSVAVNKQKHDDWREAVLKELSYAFPRLSTLQNVRPGKTLQLLIMDVFRLSIVFCRETVQYFAGSSLRRLLKSLSEKDLEKTTSDLRIKLSEIHKECEITMLQLLFKQQERIEELGKCIRKLDRTGRNTNDIVNGLEARAKDKSLLRLMERLQLETEDVDLEAIANQVEGILDVQFADQRHNHKAVCRMSSSILKQEPVFNTWYQQTKSGVLLIGGNNYFDHSDVELNWLSWASVWAARSLDGGGCPLVFFCQTTYNMNRRARCTFHQIVDSLIYQLAAMHPDGLQAQQKTISKARKSTAWNNVNRTVAFEARTRLLIELMASFVRGTIFTIIIDRLDRSCGGEDPNEDIDALQDSMSAILDLVRDDGTPKPLVKVLLAMDDVAARKLAKNFDWAKTSGLAIKVGWNQDLEDS